MWLPHRLAGRAVTLTLARWAVAANGGSQFTVSARTSATLIGAAIGAG